MTEISKIGSQPTTPEMLLKMLLANYEDRIESVVVSVVTKAHGHKTFWNEMSYGDMCFHAMKLYQDIQQNTEGQDADEESV